MRMSLSIRRISKYILIDCRAVAFGLRPFFRALAKIGTTRNHPEPSRTTQHRLWCDIGMVRKTRETMGPSFWAALRMNGGRMSRGEIALIAMRYDTSMSRAMLRALGLRPMEPAPAVGSVVSVDRYEGIDWCFENHGSPMDTMR